VDTSSGGGAWTTTYQELGLVALPLTVHISTRLEHYQAGSSRRVEGKSLL
jgi:hypothetical protein